MAEENNTGGFDSTKKMTTPPGISKKKRNQPRKNLKKAGIKPRKTLERTKNF